MYYLTKFINTDGLINGIKGTPYFTEDEIVEKYIYDHYDGRVIVRIDNNKIDIRRYKNKNLISSFIYEDSIINIATRAMLSVGSNHYPKVFKASIYRGNKTFTLEIDETKRKTITYTSGDDIFNLSWHPNGKIHNILDQIICNEQGKIIIINYPYTNITLNDSGTITQLKIKKSDLYRPVSEGLDKFDWLRKYVSETRGTSRIDTSRHLNGYASKKRKYEKIDIEDPGELITNDLDDGNQEYPIEQIYKLVTSPLGMAYIRTCKYRNFTTEVRLIDGFVDNQLVIKDYQNKIKYIYNYNKGNLINIKKLDNHGNLIMAITPIVNSISAIIREFYPHNGNLYRVYRMENGKLNGIYCECYENGNSKITTQFTNGLLNGAFIHFYENGKKHIVARYCDGSIYGTFTVYYEDGAPKLLANYVSGILHGNVVMFTRDKIVQLHACFNSGIITGEFIQRLNGINITCHFKEGKLSGDYKELKINDPYIYCRYKNGELDGKYIEYGGKEKVKNFNFDEGKKHGLFIESYSNGQPKKNYYYEKNGVISYYKEFYPNKSLRKSMHFNSGAAYDCIRINYDNGKLRILANCTDGKLCGAYKEYYPTCQIKIHCNYINNIAEGFYIEYFINGKYKILGYRKGGMFVGNYTEFYENGEKKLECYIDEGGRICGTLKNYDRVGQMEMFEFTNGALSSYGVL